MTPSEQIATTRARQLEIESEQRRLNIEHRTNEKIIKLLEKQLEELRELESSSDVLKSVSENLK